MTKVTIKNYQSVKNVSFEIDGFTVIVGKNNIGKSAIIRALEAPLTNQVGKNFIRLGEKNTFINIETDKMDIKWEKGASATYTIDDKRDGAEGLQVFSKLNRDVPKPLIDAGFGKIELGDKKVFPFIAPQFDELFLVDKPGSIVTEVLASLYNIDVLSRADDACQKAIRSQKSDLKTREGDLAKVQGKLEKFKDFDKIKETVAEIVLKEKECENLGSEIQVIEAYYTELKELVETLAVLRDVPKIVIPDISACTVLNEDLQWLREKEQKYNELTDSVEKLKGVPKLKIPKTKKLESLVKEVDQLCEWDDTSTGLIAEIKQQKELLDKFDIKNLTKKTSSIEKILQEYNEIVTLEKSLTELASETRELRDETKKLVTELEEKKKEQPKECPLCGRPLK